MSFSSLQFIFIFLPIFFIIYYLLPKKWRNLWIFAASVAFYAVGTMDKPQYIALLLLSVIVNFILGKNIGKRVQRIDMKGAKAVLTAGIVYNLLWLCVFKYSDFIFENINFLAEKIGGEKLIEPWNLLLPLGISFYTFQSISYLVDIYRDDVKAEKSFADFGAYLTMFPKLTMGPITRYGNLSYELKKRKLSLAVFDDGLRYFALGLGLKVLLANRIGSCWSDIQTVGFESISSPVAWMGIFAYSFQLYFDFYGYSMMAVGLGRMMGFTLPVNFEHPYESLTMTEFWRRWHMTLGSWFRDYVYIPLGGNRVSMSRLYFNLLVVWLLTGFWHGAGWNFIIWGLFLFAIIAIEKTWLKKIMDRIKPLGHLYMLFLIPLSWMIFAITDIDQLVVYTQRLFDFTGRMSDTVYDGDFAKYLDMYGVLLAVCFVMCTSVPRRLFEHIRKKVAGTIILFIIFWASVYLIYLGLNDPFLYFRF